MSITEAGENDPFPTQVSRGDPGPRVTNQPIRSSGGIAGPTLSYLMRVLPPVHQVPPQR